MVVHWWRLRDRHWRKSLTFNAVGALLSAIVLITAAITKFTQGAWFAALTVGLFILVATRIRHHYDLVAEALTLHPHAVEIPSRTIAPPRSREGAKPAGAPVPGPAPRRRPRRGRTRRARRLPRRSTPC